MSDDDIQKVPETAWWLYDQLPEAPYGGYDWSPAERGQSEFDCMDFHLDLGCGTRPKGRLGIDRYPAPGVGLVMDLDLLYPSMEPEENDPEKLMQLIPIQGRMPFPTASIESIISHHCLEHIGEGFVRLMDECHRVLKPGGIFRIVVPLFPSRTAVEDPDHRRFFMEGTLDVFCVDAEGPNEALGDFSVPYTSCQFELLEKDASKPTLLSKQWGPDDARELRVALRKKG
jgi:SAM-dependent methyltransferase